MNRTVSSEDFPCVNVAITSDVIILELRLVMVEEVDVLLVTVPGWGGVGAV